MLFRFKEVILYFCFLICESLMSKFAFWQVSHRFDSAKVGSFFNFAKFLVNEDDVVNLCLTFSEILVTLLTSSLQRNKA